jgi:hypothetical protein
MRTPLAVMCLTMTLGLTGCQGGRFVWVPNEHTVVVDDATHAAFPSETADANRGRVVVNDSSCPAASGAPGPESCKRKTVFVRGPQQKIVIERECPHEEKKAAAKAPAAERERVAVPGAAQDVILVPRTVYVPYAAQVPTRPARLVAPVTPVEEREEERAAAPDRSAEKLPPSRQADTTREAAAPTCCPTECQPTTIIEIRQMNDRIDRLHRILERLCAPGQRQ